MRLRTRVFLILFATAGSSALVVFLWARFAVLPEFGQVEADGIRKDLSRALSTLANDTAQLSRRSADWAYWDDMYQYAQDRNDEFIKINLGAVNHAASLPEVDYVVVHSASAELVWADAIDPVSRKEASVPASLLAELRQITKEILAAKEAPIPRTGLVLTDEGAFIVACSPILTSQRKGPSTGTLTFAIPCRDEYFSTLSRRLNMELAALRADAKAVQPEVALLSSLPVSQERFIVKALDSRNAVAYAAVRDVHKNPALVLRFVTSRDIYEQGREVLHYFGLCTFASALLQVLLALLLVRRLVLQPVADLSECVHEIEQSADLTRRAPVAAGGELGQLASAVNRMLESLDRSENSLRFNEARLQALVDNAVDAIITIDAQGRILSFNAAAEKTFGYDAGDVIGQSVSILMPEPFRSQHEGFLTHYLESSQAKLVGMGRDVLALHKNGTVFPIYLAVSEIRVGEQHLFTGIIRDITERKRYEEYLTHAATYDVLTGLVNRRYFDEQLEVAINSAKRYGHALSLCVCDLDKFKAVNDRYGHAVGDEVLKKVGEVIRHEVRKEDIGARLGGDEFIICFSHTPALEAKASAERIRTKLEAHVFRKGTDDPFSVTITVGIADLASHDTDTKALFEAADHALYLAKERGRNQIVVNEL